MAQGGFSGNQNAVDAIQNHVGQNYHSTDQYTSTGGSLDLVVVGQPPADPPSFVDFVPA
jgi:hypothetical protein